MTELYIAYILIITMIGLVTYLAYLVNDGRKYYRMCLKCGNTKFDVTMGMCSAIVSCSKCNNMSYKEVKREKTT